MNPTWQGNWRERIHRRLVERGYSSAARFADDRPTVTFLELALLLGPDVAPTQIEMMIYEEALRARSLTDYARRSLVRYLRECMPLGWGVGENEDFCRGHAFASWGRLFGKEYASVLRHVWSTLSAIPPPRGWLPADPDDPLLLEAFRGVSFPSPQSEAKAP